MDSVQFPCARIIGKKGFSDSRLSQLFLLIFDCKILRKINVFYITVADPVGYSNFQICFDHQMANVRCCTFQGMLNLNPYKHYKVRL